MHPEELHVIVIGGGITGLAAAYYLQQQARAKKLPLSYTLIEQNSTFGGKVISEAVDGFIIEGGPDSFLTQKPWAWQLCQELGLSDRLIGTNDHRRNVYILHQGRLLPYPGGMRLAAPTQLLPFLRSPLISPWGKLRAGLDLFIPPRADDRDESLADFIGRRLGREILDKVAEPIMAGIHVADPKRLSIQSTFPNYPAAEKKYGSLIRGTLAQMKAARSQANTRSRLPMFMSLKGGLGELIEALVGRLNGALLTGQPVMALRIEPGAPRPYRVQLADGAGYQADSVIMTTPAYIAAELLRPHHATLADQLSQIRYLSSATISLAYNKTDISHPLDGFGFVAPKTESCRLLACTWISTKFDHRAPADQVLLRAFVGGYSQEALVNLPDDGLATLVREELANIMGLQARPTRQAIYRWPRANPQYDVGHLTRARAIKRLAQEDLPGLYLTGSAFDGLGLPDCVRQAKETAEHVIQYLAHVGAEPLQTTHHAPR